MDRCTVELLQEQVDALVINSLKENLEFTLDCYPGDVDLVESIVKVLSYLMIPSEYAEYMIGLEDDIRIAKEKWNE